MGLWKWTKKVTKTEWKYRIEFTMKKSPFNKLGD